MIRLITTFFGAGLLPKAPGTWGSLAAIPVAYVLHGLGSFPLLAVATVGVFLLGWWATTIQTRGSDDHDPSSIVIDEVAGIWIALWPLSYGMAHVGAEPWVFPYPGWIGAFLAFRLFDIWKPWPVSWADNKHTALGVMLDDVVAGIMAAILVMIAAVLWHVVIL
ncbi:MAG TPA: phosphatidylglycerophosphatase A [Paracoccaceae bacterium]|nr:phosphatidylglycerophosphatase A [Paracoccaceae bacterium]